MIAPMCIEANHPSIVVEKSIRAINSERMRNRRVVACGDVEIRDAAASSQAKLCCNGLHVQIRQL